METTLIIALASIVFGSHPVIGRSIHLQKRAAFYIANETACVVDNTVYYNGDPIPTDDPCEACKCRPPGFACVLRECEVKPGCRAVRRAGHCCPEYICGCEHNGRMYRDGDEIRDSQNPCYTCHCQGSAIACAFVDCFFRVDCAPDYVPGECCPRYDHCSPLGPGSNESFAYSQSTTVDAQQSSTNPTQQQEPSTTLPPIEIESKDVTLHSTSLSPELTTAKAKSAIENEVNIGAEGKELSDHPNITEDKEEPDSRDVLGSPTEKVKIVFAEVSKDSITEKETSQNADLTTTSMQTLPREISTLSYTEEKIPTLKVEEKTALEADKTTEVDKTDAEIKEVSEEITGQDITTTDYTTAQTTSKKEEADVHFKFDLSLVHNEESSTSIEEKSDSQSTEAVPVHSKDPEIKELSQSTSKSVMESETVTEAQNVFLKNLDEKIENAGVEEKETEPVLVSTESGNDTKLTISTESSTLVPIPVLFIDAQELNIKRKENYDKTDSGVTIFKEEVIEESDPQTTQNLPINEQTDKVEPPLLPESPKLAAVTDIKIDDPERAKDDATTTKKAEQDIDTSKESPEPQDADLVLKSLSEIVSSEQPQEDEPIIIPVEENAFTADDSIDKDIMISTQDQSLQVSETTDGKQRGGDTSHKKDKSLDGELPSSSEIPPIISTSVKDLEKYSTTSDIELTPVTAKDEEHPIEHHSSEVLSDSLEETDRGKIDDAQLTTVRSQQASEHKDTSSMDDTTIINQSVDKETTIQAEIDATTPKFD